MKMQESPEDYLEAVLVLAMKLLRENGYVAQDDNGYLILTGSGLSIALKIYERHLVLSQFLISIGVNEETAKKDACRMEHVISDETFEKLKQLPR